MYHGQVIGFTITPDSEPLLFVAPIADGQFIVNMTIVVEEPFDGTCYLKVSAGNEILNIWMNTKGQFQNPEVFEPTGPLIAEFVAGGSTKGSAKIYYLLKDRT